VFPPVAPFHRRKWSRNFFILARYRGGLWSHTRGTPGPMRQLLLLWRERNDDRHANSLTHRPTPLPRVPPASGRFLKIPYSLVRSRAEMVRPTSPSFLVNNISVAALSLDENIEAWSGQRAPHDGFPAVLRHNSNIFDRRHHNWSAVTVPSSRTISAQRNFKKRIILVPKTSSQSHLDITPFPVSNTSRPFRAMFPWSAKAKVGSSA